MEKRHSHFKFVAKNVDPYSPNYRSKSLELTRTLSSPSGLDGTLRVSIPLEQPLRPVLGSKAVVPCYFQDDIAKDPGAAAPLLHRIKWTYITKDKISTILVASEGKVHVETEYLDRVTMINYPLVSSDASVEITELRSRDSGTYRCEVTHGVQDNYDSVDIQVQGAPQNPPRYKNIAAYLSAPTVQDG